MSGLVTRDDLRTVLEDWESGKRMAGEVHEWAEARYAVSAWDCEDDVANEVLAALEMLDMNLLTRDDVPVLRAMLELPTEQATRAAELLDAHFQVVNLDDRKKTLASEPIYARFCGK
jgi:predicted RNA methylase